MTERFEPEGYFNINDAPQTSSERITEYVLTHNDQFTYRLQNLEAGYDSGLAAPPERTTYVLIEGTANVTIERADGSKRTEKVGPNDGWYVPTDAKVHVIAIRDSKILVASSPVIKLSDSEAKEVFPWLPKDHFISLNDGSKLERAHKVDKPWGGEDWLTVIEDGYVLKRIWMKKDKRCSLQQHEYKTETNYLIKGKAKLLLADTIEELEPTSRMVGPGEGWYVPVMKIHRVISQDDYTAFEISTPHVKDVIRLEDDTGRSSGHLESEHAVNK